MPLRQSCHSIHPKITVIQSFDGEPANSSAKMVHWAMPSNSLTITDNRTGKSYELPIENETIRATDLRQMKEKADDFGLMPYDPAYMNTASCKSTITYID